MYTDLYIKMVVSSEGFSLQLDSVFMKKFYNVNKYHKILLINKFKQWF